MLAWLENIEMPICPRSVSHGETVLHEGLIFIVDVLAKKFSMRTPRRDSLNLLTQPWIEHIEVLTPSKSFLSRFNFQMVPASNQSLSRLKSVVAQQRYTTINDDH